MAITQTPRLALNKIDLDDAGSRGNWAQYLNENCDRLDERIVRSGDTGPVGVIDPFNRGEFFFNYVTRELWVSHGSGITDWQLVSIAATAAVYGVTVANGIEGGNTVANNWTQRNLAEIADPGNMATATGGGFTIPAGTYLIRARSAFYGAVGGARIRLWNNTDATEALLGGNYRSNTADLGFQAMMEGVVTITANKNFRLEYRCENAVTDGLGKHDGMGAGNENYAMVVIERIA